MFWLLIAQHLLGILAEQYVYLFLLILTCLLNIFVACILQVNYNI